MITFLDDSDKTELENNIAKRVPFPLSNGEVNNGILNQALFSDGNGGTVWGACVPKTWINASEYVAEDGTFKFSDLPLTGDNVIYFEKGEYNVAASEISEFNNLTFLFCEAKFICSGSYLVDITNCENVSIYGGTISGTSAQFAINASGCKRISVEKTFFSGIGNSSIENAAGLRLIGNCDNFRISQCKFKDITAGVISSDGYIHSYGILVNRSGSTNEYSRSGIIENCAFNNIASSDNGEKKGDGDGIFIQNPPYVSNDDLILRDDCRIVVRNCIFTDCKKRGIKSSAYGTLIENCVFSGAFWYAAIDMQYGHNIVRHCHVINTSDYNNSVTSGIVASDGGFTVEDTYFSCPYYDAPSSKNTYHPGIRFTTRLPASVIAASEPWDDCKIVNCYFDGVSRGVFAYNSNSDADTYKIKSIDIIGCRFGRFNQSHCVNISNTMFNEIDSFKFIDFELDYGTNRDDVKTVLSDFSYPIGIGLDPVLHNEIHSKKWTMEPRSGYDALPTSPSGYIEFIGVGRISYKRYTAHGSEIYGTVSPTGLTATREKQLMYNSKIGDKYTNTSNGDIYVCTEAGTGSSIGTWTLL